MDITEIQEELFRLEYPNLLPDQDPDIEQYFALRSGGRAQEALVIYRSKLLPRYPDDEFRSWLLRAYRSRDPAFRGLLAIGYRMLGARSLERIKKIILFIAEKAESYNEKDLYSTIKAAEDIARFLPSDRYEAAAGIERYYRYASVLKLKEHSLSRAVELIRGYLSDTLSVIEAERRRRSAAENAAREQERRRLVKADYDSYLFQKKHGYGSAHINPAADGFSEADIARIEIPHFNRVEDQVLAYCTKYWNLVHDAVFERTLFIYSRKYGKKNYDVFMAIRRGRAANHRDDEILAAVIGILITGYYYSIHGDMYLQRNWSAIKLAMQKQELQARIGKGSRQASRRLENAAKIVPRSLKAIKVKAAVPKPVSRTKTSSRVKKLTKLQERRKGGGRQLRFRPEPVPAAAKPEIAAAAAVAAMTVPETRTAAAVQTSARPEIKPPRQNPAAAVSTPAAPPPAERRLPPQGRAAFKTSLEKAGGSVSDRLKELSGRSYDVYQDRFLAKARGAVRKVLRTGRGRFFTPPEEAEDLVYAFLKNHYSDPYMNWENSTARKKLLSMGFDLPSISRVIDECYKVL
jgi:hypothetical protein